MGEQERQRKKKMVDEGEYSSASDARVITGRGGWIVRVTASRADGTVQIGLQDRYDDYTPDAVYALIRKLRFAVSVVRGTQPQSE
jgi:hypothetical protein